MKRLFAKSKLIKSRLFIRMFLSYILIISLFFAAFSVSILFQYHTAYQKNLRQEYSLKVGAIGNTMDFELLNAQHIVSSINGSQTLRNLYSTVAVEKAPVNSYLLYQSLQELKSIKSSGNHYQIYNVILLFKDCRNAYTASSVIPLENGYLLNLEGPFIRGGMVRDLLGVTSVRDIIFNTEYIIYGDEYSYSTSALEKGSILILFDKKIMEQKIEKILERYSGYRVLFGDEVVLEKGELTENCFQSASSVNPSVSYELYADNSAFAMGFNEAPIAALTVGFLLSAVFAVFAYLLSIRYYSPIGNIERYIESGEMAGIEEEKRQDEFGAIIKGIKSLIGENNGFRERMVHISPYAKQGILHDILSGNMERNNLRILIDEKYIDLKRTYFALALTNVAYRGTGETAPLKQRDALDIIRYICQEQSSEEMQIDCYVKDTTSVFLIVNSDEMIQLEEVFYNLHRAICREIDDENCLITIGVGQVEDNIERLSEACRDAVQALDGMLTGGRNTVYFYEPAKDWREKEYYFPKDAQGRLLKAFKESNIEELHAFLDEIYEKNTKDYDASPETIRLLVDELHLLTLNVFKNINIFHTTKIQIDKIEQAATLEEIFDYYHAVYETVCNESAALLMPKKDMEKLDREILSYLEENYKNPDLSLALLGKKFGVSNKYISMICKTHLGKTYLQYIQEKRILYAAELLRTTSKTMEEIAAECGYGNVLTFRRNFKSIMNVNPGDYR